MDRQKIAEKSADSLRELQGVSRIQKFVQNSQTEVVWGLHRKLRKNWGEDAIYN